MRDIVTERINTRQKELGLTTRQLAEKLCLSKRTVEGWKWGQTHPRSTDIVDVCTALECNPDYLFGFSDKPQKAQHWLWK